MLTPLGREPAVFVFHFFSFFFIFHFESSVFKAFNAPQNLSHECLFRYIAQAMHLKRQSRQSKLRVAEMVDARAALMEP